MNPLLVWILAFLLTAAADVAWTRYFIETEDRRAIVAGAWSALIVALGLFNVSLFLGHRWLAGSACVAGGFVGTWVTIKLAEK